MSLLSNIVFVLSPLFYTLYLITSNGLLLSTCSIGNINIKEPEVILYFVGLFFKLSSSIVTIGTFYINKNNNALYASVIVTLGAVILHTLICVLVYYRDCNVIFIMISFSILGDLASIIMYISAVITILRN